LFKRHVEPSTRRAIPANVEQVEDVMLSWALIFLVVALIAGVLGFAGIAGAAAGIAKLLFLVFLVLFVISLVMHGVRGRGPVVGP
jgi:uncharacterized membrane protein YtjA (UPF0391 family)